MKKSLIVLLALMALLSGCQKIENDDTVLTVGMECASPPFNWTQNTQSEDAVEIDGGVYCDGYDVAIAKMIANHLQKELKIHANPVFDMLLTDIQNNTIDLIIAGMTDTESRRQSIDFSDVYYDISVVLVVRKDSSYASATSIQDFKGARLSAQVGTIYDELIDQIEGVDHKLPMANNPLLSTNVINDALDGFITEDVIAEAITLNNPELTYLRFEDANNFVLQEDTTVSIGVSKKNSALKDKVNEFLNTLTVNDRIEIMNQAIKRQP